MALSIDNFGLLRGMLLTRAIRMVDAPRLRVGPGPMPEGLAWDRVEGMLLGLAIGDALGNGTESMTPAGRRARFGEIRGYFGHRNNGRRPIGTPSDDSQMAFWMLECLVDDGGLVPDHLARAYSTEQIFGIGASVRKFVRTYKGGTPWQQAGTESAGNGAIMRIAPIMVPHLRSGTKALWADAALAATVTHNDYASNAACVAFVGILWQLLKTETAPEPGWWVDTFCDAMADLEGDTEYATRGAPREFAGRMSAYVRDCVSSALAEGLSCEDACNSWHSAAYLMETLPSVVYILARYGHDPEEAIVRAVNDTWDNDTVGAIVGAAVGALHGKSALPAQWLDKLTGRTRADDDGHIQELVEQARLTFWDG